MVEKKRVARSRNDGRGFSVVATDLNDDGLVDIYVANDMNPDFLFLNRDDGTFDDAAETSVAAYTQSAMVATTGSRSRP